MRRALPLCAACVLAGLPSPLRGQAGRILQGTVVSARDGEPVAEAVVRLLHPASPRRRSCSPSRPGW